MWFGKGFKSFNSGNISSWSVAQRSATPQKVNVKLLKYQNFGSRKNIRVYLSSQWHYSLFWYEKSWNIVILAMFTKASLLQNWGKLQLFGSWQVYMKFPVQKSLSNQFFITIGRPLSTRKPWLGLAFIHWGGTLGS